MHTAVTGHPPYIHDQIPLDLDVPPSAAGFCPGCNKTLSPEESAKYKGTAYCNECTWEMWRNTSW